MFMCQQVHEPVITKTSALQYNIFISFTHIEALWFSIYLCYVMENRTQQARPNTKSNA